ncbi:MAG: sulfatase-like hydrolase/transferase [Clostridia bacterium]|nr:sulfatase-like hydrolase/transferase [Clostridia bacterium]
MENKFSLDKNKKIFPIVLMVVGVILAAVLLITRLNLINLVCLLYCCIMSALILLSLIIKKKVYAPMIFGYAISSVAMIVFHTIWGADAGFGAFISDKSAGWSTAANALFAGEGSFFTRLGGNILLTLPAAVCLWALFFVAKKKCGKTTVKAVASFALSILLMGASVFSVLFGNMRTKPVTERLWEGHDDYLDGVDKATAENPNVLIIMMDDLGYGDVSLNGSIYETPNIDSIGENGLNFENFYSAYSVCSPARFACLTGRYPYRGYADNVIYPTVQTTGNFAQTRIYNSFEMGNNVDGMLGDEITIAEVFKSAGYSTAAFGKWHLGDYGEYLPTNQGFDYFYGSHHVNDMYAFYHVAEENGEYEIVHDNSEMRDENGKKDQSKLTEWIHDEITNWITETVTNSDAPFFAYYASPWPHGPVFAGDDFDGSTGMGTYVDCITEFDTYLGTLFKTMEDLGVLEDTIIVFTSDNGPALEGSVADLRGGKYLAYEGGQKVPFMIRWDNNNGLFESGGEREQSAVLVDLFPTLVEMCGITGNGGTENYLPTDREIDGVSMVPVISGDEVVHTEDNPILHMKRENIKAIQYTVTTESVKADYPDYNYSVLNDNEYVTFKYFEKIQNDNSAFWDKYRKNWLHILTDDYAENYNRSTVYPTVADEMNAKLNEIQKKFADNRRGIIE